MRALLAFALLLLPSAALADGAIAVADNQGNLFVGVVANRSTSEEAANAAKERCLDAQRGGYKVSCTVVSAFVRTCGAISKPAGAVGREMYDIGIASTSAEAVNKANKGCQYKYATTCKPAAVACDATQVATTARACQIGSITLRHEEARLFYTTSTVGPPDSCDQHAIYRQCKDGTLTGSPSYSFPTCSAGPVVTQVLRKECSIGGLAMVDGESAIFFEKSGVSLPDTCQAHSIRRVCANGVLTGNPNFDRRSCITIEPAPASTPSRATPAPWWLTYGAPFFFIAGKIETILYPPKPNAFLGFQWIPRVIAWAAIIFILTIALVVSPFVYIFILRRRAAGTSSISDSALAKFALYFLASLLIVAACVPALPTFLDYVSNMTQAIPDTPRMMPALFWYIAIFCGVIVIGAALLPRRYQVYEPPEALQQPRPIGADIGIKEPARPIVDTKPKPHHEPVMTDRERMREEMKRTILGNRKASEKPANSPPPPREPAPSSPNVVHSATYDF